MLGNPIQDFILNPKTVIFVSDHILFVIRSINFFSHTGMEQVLHNSALTINSNLNVEWLDHPSTEHHLSYSQGEEYYF